MLLVTAWSAMCAAPGCSRQRPYSLGAASQYHTSPKLVAMTTPQIERGKPRPVLDSVGWVIGIPGKIVLWDRRIDNHRVSPATETAVAEYLAANELSGVKVRVNQYAPMEEWRRLRANQSVGWGWRYTFGTFSWLGYTIFPGRIWGGDNYNPYTNTLSLFSDVPAVALHEGGHAKDFSRRTYPGTYAAIYALPVVPLWHEGVATRDALGYLREFGSAEEEREAYTLLYPAYGTYVGGAVGDVIPGVGLAAYCAAVAGGHVAGRVKASRIEPRERMSPRSDWTGLSTMLPPRTVPPDAEYAAQESARAGRSLLNEEPFSEGAGPTPFPAEELQASGPTAAAP
ncbi:MAG: hypothetical protein C0483_10160 [Pirellula sp.]|nr:hypothetical protein [Pirellula sp.]